MFSSIFSQRSGIHQPIAGSVMNAWYNGPYDAGKKGIGNLFSGGGNNYTDDDRIGGIRSQLSNLIRGGQLQQDHPLVQYVQQNAGIQDPQQATQYTQQALEMMNEHANTINLLRN